MKKTFLLLCLLLLFAEIAQAGKLTNIRFGSYPEKIRLVFDFNLDPTYTIDETKEKLVIHLLNTEAISEIKSYLELGDLAVRYLEVEREDNGLKITLPFAERVPYNIFTLNDPPRLVIDFDREFTNIVSGGIVIDGVENLKVSQATQRGRISANVLKIDLEKAEVAPALARKRKPNLFESFINLINPWKENDPDRHFYRSRVKDIAEEQGAAAAVNGTYFAYSGKPLGTLLIDKELVSSPIYDRTALIISDENQAYIDNITIDSYFQTPNRVRYDFTGINQGRKENSVVMYTPVWGENTGTDSKGIELSIVNSEIKEIHLGNSRIPTDGYVISLNGPMVQFISDNLKKGDKLDVHIKIIPYATAPKSILHMLSGGPRLLKDGIIYVTKHEEKFKSDIATGRAARTAVGITKDKQLLLVTVDGLPRKKTNRSEKSSLGMTLEELANLMQNLGAVEAMNLDGGSSTTMYINGRVVNQPVGESEQKVSNAIVVRPKSN